MGLQEETMKKKRFFCLFGFVMFLSACISSPKPTGIRIKELPRDASDLVSASGNCSRCHTGLKDAEGEDISFDNLWRTSMMANAARDPYWLATVSSEVQMNPGLKDMIEDKCAVCHMPLARFDAHVRGNSTNILGDGFADPGNKLHDLAIDGVSCNICHQIMPDNFKKPESFSGSYIIDKENREWGGRVSYGPFPVKEKMAKLMVQFSGYLPVQSDHVTDPALCATCHTLYTPYLNHNGEIAGTFPEQTVYQEWENSSYADKKTCLDCHMPIVDGGVAHSSIIGDTHEYLHKHTFTGANAFMLKMLKVNADELNVTAEDRHLDSTLAGITEQLQNSAGTVKVEEVTIFGGKLVARVAVTSAVGHKFPSGFPSRRLWLHFTVTDAKDKIIFDSGEVNANGLIVDNDNDADAALYEPHYRMINRQDQVQIYEAILQNTDAEVTTNVLRASGYHKDNRLLPIGFNLKSVDPDISPHGFAVGDSDFAAGNDRLTYLVEVNDASGPFTVKVELLYQSIGYRWAENLRSYNTELTERFIGFYDAIDNLPVMVSSATVKTIGNGK